jgi:DNA repair protein RecN (Recombination protein N)
MLSELRIQNFAIIDELSLEFAPGFNVFTGETGAGKSIIVDAVELLLGGRADSAFVRSGMDAAIVEGTFQLQDSVRDRVHAILEQESLLDDPEFLILGREIRKAGRNICRVNGRVVTLVFLREVGELLVDVHGQSEHLSLLRVPEHIHLLDRFSSVDSTKTQFVESYRSLGKLRKLIGEIQEQRRDAVRQAELLEYQINDIESARIKSGEEHELFEERTRLANAEQLAKLADQAINALDEGIDEAPTASELLGEAAHDLANLAKIDRSMQPQADASQVAIEQLGELARQMRDYRDEIEFNPRRLDTVEERIGLLSALKRKYGDDLAGVLLFAERARKDLDLITNSEERLTQLVGEEQSLLKSLGTLGDSLSQKRRAASEILARGIEAELLDLRMEGAEFKVDFQVLEDEDGVLIDGRRVAIYPTGIDRVEFLVSPNPGEGLNPLAKTASGGETSRLMLGLKSVLAQADHTPTLIFDEIDQGIGGRVGSVVGQKLWKLARSHQVLCITHLPQLASYGDRHFKVEKQVIEGRTRTEVRAMDSGDRNAELALMLGGVDQPNLESAAHLIDLAEQTINQALTERS